MTGLFSGISTALAMLAFVGTVVWAYSRRRERDFEALSRLPLEEDAPARQEEGQ
ncbi:MAG: Cbb3-type cytochrome oxidase component FixQ [Pseudomonadota bacterium]|jgi:cytochrome c oxidase cbb3-type subunit 4